jgi:hypothetical protein
MIIIATSLTSNNFINAHKLPQEYNKPIPKLGKQRFSRCNQVSSQESEGGKQHFSRTHLNLKTFLDIAFLDITVSTPTYGIVNYS